MGYSPWVAKSQTRLNNWAHMSLSQLVGKWKLVVAQSCLTLCDPMDCSPSGFSVHGILQARILEWVAIPFSRGSSWLRDRTWISRTVGKFFTIWATRKASSLYENLPPSHSVFQLSLIFHYQTLLNADTWHSLLSFPFWPQRTGVWCPPWSLDWNCSHCWVPWLLIQADTFNAYLIAQHHLSYILFHLR